MGASHTNSVTGEDLMPHVHDKSVPGKVRSPRPEEILQNWYNGNCDGYWEHMFMVKIDTLDNPGWRVSIDLLDTPLEEKIFEERKHYIDENNWIYCMVKDGIFQGRGDSYKLKEILEIFKEWADS